MLIIKMIDAVTGVTISVADHSVEILVPITISIVPKHRGNHRNNNGQNNLIQLPRIEAFLCVH